MPWKKVTKDYSHLTGREARITMAVRRNRSGGQASLIIPEHMHSGEKKCEIYSDGTRLAFALGARGEYKTTSPGPNSKALAVTIPAKFSHLIPYGTHDISYEMDGDMIVVDLADVATIRVAAE